MWLRCNKRPFATEPSTYFGFGQRHVVCTTCCLYYQLSVWSANILHMAYATKIQGIMRTFCLNAQRVTDSAAFPIQSVENEVPTQGWSSLRHQADIGVILVLLFFLLFKNLPSMSLSGIYLQNMHQSSTIRPTFIFIPTSFLEEFVPILNHITSTHCVRVCVCVCVCVHACVCHLCVCVCACQCVCVHRRICLCIQVVHMYMFVLTGAYVHVCVCLCAFVSHAHVCVWACV